MPPCYIDRGDFAGEWPGFPAGLNTGIWETLDFSSKVPAGAKAIIFRVRANNTVAGESIQMQPHGSLQAPGHCVFAVPSANIVNRAILTIGCDADRKIDYQATALGLWGNEGCSMRGWIL